MSPRGKVVSFGIRQPSPAKESAIQALEDKAEALGNGVAGRAVKPVAPVRATKAPRPVAATEPPHSERGIIQRKGRIKADGSRTEARTLRRVTVYLEPETMKAVELLAVETGQNKSEVIQDALAGHLDV